MIGKMMILQTPAFQHFTQTPKSLTYSRLIVLLVGAAYGGFGILANASFIAGFESALLRNALVPLIFILFGLFSVWLTKIGLTVLLWAGARGFGGPGRISEISRSSSIALLPGLLAVPTLTGLWEGWLMILPLVIGVVWMYFICVKIHITTQRFAPWKAYLSVFAVFVFFASIYYMIMPTGALI
ncbi:hypothetical protein JSY36_13280 [Bacillus sp. H-16]|uniref:hypothetical protein n=1 Tax=Alteribacter salitolerans TaxID=2912333 RepID=UPI001963867F|nr:hypothetical protein [Alteribacter salitolerans]MBM7096713.1 hypothetical protein [Alteribacter salitolerans]